MSKSTKIYIKHRINGISELASVEQDWGVEIDLRSDVRNPGKIHLSHDAWKQGDDFENWLDAFAGAGIRGPIILNTKEDGLETRALELLQQRGLSSYFFLDTAFPTLRAWTQVRGNSAFALRFSEVEPIESIRPFVGKAQWIWIDCFDQRPISNDLLEQLKKYREQFRFCLVSPELQGAQQPLAPAVLETFRPLAEACDAICTKDPKRWQELGMR